MNQPLITKDSPNLETRNAVCADELIIFSYAVHVFIKKVFFMRRVKSPMLNIFNATTLFTRNHRALAMYINWLHHYLPKVFALFSVLVNTFLIYILQNDKKNKLGSYRLLLLFFSLYNLSCTSLDITVPLYIFDYRYAFSAFIVDGYFEQKSQLGEILLCFRCGLVPASYAILHAHFIYRYLVLVDNSFLVRWFIPYGLLLTLAHCVFLMTFWFYTCYRYLDVDTERLVYLEGPIHKAFGVNVFDLNIISAQYKEGSSDAVSKSWIGILILSCVSLISLAILFVLTARIVRELSKQRLLMSTNTRIMQQQFIKALVVQAVIPILASFTPCLIAWYEPMFMVNIGEWLFLICVISISIFPFLDPLALFFFIPVFRNRVRKMAKLSPSALHLRNLVVNSAT